MFGGLSSVLRGCKVRIKCEYRALTTVTFNCFQISRLWFNIPLPHINSSEWVKVEGDAIIFFVHQQVMRVAVCAASIRCRLCSATSTTCAISLPAPITVTGCPPQSQWLPWWTRFPVTGFARTSAVVLSVIHPHRWVYVYVITCNMIKSHKSVINPRRHYTPPVFTPSLVCEVLQPVCDTSSPVCDACSPDF